MLVFPLHHSTAPAPPKERNPQAARTLEHHHRHGKDNHADSVANADADVPPLRFNWCFSLARSHVRKSRIVTEPGSIRADSVEY